MAESHKNERIITRKYESYGNVKFRVKWHVIPNLFDHLPPDRLAHLNRVKLIRGNIGEA